MNVKSLSKRGYQALFKCNKCSVEWEAHSTESQCLVCNGRGRNLPIKRIDITEPIKKLINIIKEVSIKPPQSENNNDLIKKFKCDDCQNEFFDAPNKQSINRPGSKKKLCKTCYEKRKKRVQIKKYQVTFKCNKCSAEWKALNTNSQCLKCDGKGSPKKKVKIQSVKHNKSVIVPEKDGIKNKLPKDKSYTVPFKCNKCSTIWEAKNTESQCLKCDGKGINIPRKDFTQKKKASSFIVPFKCNKCFAEWEALNTEFKCLRLDCDGRGQNIPRNVENLRQFSCEKCYNAGKKDWNKWRYALRVKCEKCEEILHPIPHEEEFGICNFNCSKCSRKFVGFGSMSEKLDLRSKCYRCHKMVKPYEVIPNRDDINKETTNTHSCTGCNGRGKCPFYRKALAFSSV